jgi:hypothetical protein
MKQNISWTNLEPRDEHNDCASTGVWEGHTFHISRLANGKWACSREYDGIVKILTPAGGVRTGKEAWQTARDDVISRTVWFLKRSPSRSTS